MLRTQLQPFFDGGIFCKKHLDRVFSKSKNTYSWQLPSASKGPENSKAKLNFVTTTLCFTLDPPSVQKGKNFMVSFLHILKKHSVFVSWKDYDAQIGKRFFTDRIRVQRLVKLSFSVGVPETEFLLKKQTGCHRQRRRESQAWWPLQIRKSH